MKMLLFRHFRIRIVTMIPKIIKNDTQEKIQSFLRILYVHTRSQKSDTIRISVLLVVFIPLYTFAGFYICSPLQCFLLISIYNFHFENLSFILFHISYIPHFSSSWLFFRFFFFNVLSSGFPTLFLPINFQLSFLSGGHNIFPIRGQLFHSSFFWQMSHSQFSSLLDCFSAFLLQFCYEFESCFPNSAPLISLMSCTPTVKFQIFSLFVFSFFLLWSSIFVFLALSACRQFPVLPIYPHFSLHFVVPKIPIYNHSFTSSHNLPLIRRGYFPLSIFPNSHFPRSPNEHVRSTRRHLEISISVLFEVTKIFEDSKIMS